MMLLDRSFLKKPGSSARCRFVDCLISLGRTVIGFADDKQCHQQLLCGLICHLSVMQGCYPRFRLYLKGRCFTMLIRGILLSAVLGASAIHASAADLLRVRANSSETVYVDRDTIKVKDGLATVWSIWDLAVPRTNLFSEGYRSVLVKNEYNCSKRTGRVVEVVEFSDAMAQGGAIRTYSDFDCRPDYF